MKTLFASLLTIALVSFLGLHEAYAAADLVDVVHIQTSKSGTTFVTIVNLKMKVNGETSFKANNRGVATPESKNVTMGQPVTIRVASPQAHNTLIIRNAGHTESVSW